MSVPRRCHYPELASPLRIGAARDGAAAIEVVVNERGTVDSARAKTAPRTIGEASDFMGKLSAIKTWRFHPAMKLGRPVRYPVPHSPRSVLNTQRSAALIGLFVPVPWLREGSRGLMPREQGLAGDDRSARQ